MALDYNSTFKEDIRTNQRSYLGVKNLRLVGQQLMESKVGVVGRVWGWRTSGWSASSSWEVKNVRLVGPTW